MILFEIVEIASEIVHNSLFVSSLHTSKILLRCLSSDASFYEAFIMLYPTLMKLATLRAYLVHPPTHKLAYDLFLSKNSSLIAKKFSIEFSSLPNYTYPWNNHMFKGILELVGVNYIKKTHMHKLMEESK
jgi:hypothetical protein